MYADSTTNSVDYFNFETTNGNISGFVPQPLEPVPKKNFDASQLVELLIVLFFCYLSVFYIISQAIFYVLTLSLKRVGKEFGSHLNECLHEANAIEEVIQIMEM